MNDDHLAEQILKDLRGRQSAFWEKEREKNALALFHRASIGVPAYKDFLKKNRIEPAKIKTFADLQGVPPMTKKGYLRQYPLEKLVWEGTLHQPMVFTSTSGSTGRPFYFPRSYELDWESSIVHEFFLENSSYGRKGSTLVIVGFGMGAWIGGLITYRAFEIASQRGAKVAIITPGINKGEIFNALRDLAPQFDQVILAGYPPLVKDIIDEAPEYGVHLKKLKLRLLFAAEAFSESFRNYLSARVGIKNPYLDTLNVYGTADIGTMAYETPTAILARTLALKHKELFQSLFSEVERTPTLAQYNPHFITFEAPEGDVMLTGNNTIPLIRYAIGDRGGVMNFDALERKMDMAGIPWKKEVSKAGIVKHITQLPFVFVYERGDLSTKLYGAIVYPEPIKDALHHPKLQKYLTGKFMMATRLNSQQNQYLEINIELKPDLRPKVALAQLSAKLILERLMAKNAEYRNNVSMMGRKMFPRVHLWPYGHQKYFRSGGKQRWVEKTH